MAQRPREIIPLHKHLEKKNTRSTKNPNAILTNVEPNVSNPIFIKN